jgi:hypothetical protein
LRMNIRVRSSGAVMLKGKTEILGETPVLPICLSQIPLTLTDLGFNPDLRDGRMAINRLSYGRYT